MCEDSSNWRQKISRGYLVTKLPAKWSMCLAHDWNAKSQYRMKTAVSREYLAGKAFLWDTRETFCSVSLYYLIHTFCTHTIYTHITHKFWGVFLRENPSHKPWELEIVIPTYLYTIACGFSLTPTSSFPYHWEVDSPNTYQTLSKCQVRIWYRWEILEEARFWRMQLGVLQDSEN